MTRLNKSILTLTIVFITSFTSNAFADLIELKNKNIIQGSVIEEKIEIQHVITFEKVKGSYLNISLGTGYRFGN